MGSNHKIRSTKQITVRTDCPLLIQSSKKSVLIIEEMKYFGD